MSPFTWRAACYQSQMVLGNLILGIVASHMESEVSLSMQKFSVLTFQAILGNTTMRRPNSLRAGTES